MIDGHTSTMGEAIVAFLFAMPFIVSSTLIIWFIRGHYPSIKISMTARLFFYIIIVPTAVLQVLYFIFTAQSMLSGSMFRNQSDIAFYVKFFSIHLTMLLQLFNSIAGIRLIRVINRNSKTEFRDSFD